MRLNRSLRDGIRIYCLRGGQLDFRSGLNFDTSTTSDHHALPSSQVLFLPSLPEVLHLRLFITLFERRSIALILGPPPYRWVGPAEGATRVGLLWHTPRGWRPVQPITRTQLDMLWQERTADSASGRWFVTPTPSVQRGLLSSPKIRAPGPGRAKRSALTQDQDDGSV